MEEEKQNWLVHLARFLVGAVIIGGGSVGPVLMFEWDPVVVAIGAVITLALVLLVFYAGFLGWDTGRPRIHKAVLFFIILLVPGANLVVVYWVGKGFLRIISDSRKR
jgi:hypothetical protein